MIDRVSEVPIVPLASMEPERATPFGPHRPLPVMSRAERDFPAGAGNAPMETSSV